MRFEDVAGVAHVHARTWQTTYRGIIPDDYLDAIQEEEWQQRWLPAFQQPQPDSFSYVAENAASGEIAGFVRGGPTRYTDLPYRGELYAIYILKDYQGHGLGRRLVRALAGDLQRAGLAEMLLWVLEANTPSRRFYEALGGQFVKTNSFDIGGVSLNECAYAWTDLGPLVQDDHA
jgi:ribosomal protein S18 acetylase RimI-like enzyme